MSAHPGTAMQSRAVPDDPLRARGSTGRAKGDLATPAAERASDEALAQPTRRRYVFTDPVAFRYLEEDADVEVLERFGTIYGYELYLVEQWACSRVHPTFIITTYTGDQSHHVVVGVLAVPANEDAWSDRLRVYFAAISQHHARPKETPLGLLMVTNLSAFPSALTVIAIPDGDVRKHREDFIVNENLKRLGCAGRAGFSLSTPTPATQSKFHQTYNTCERNDLYSSVAELVKLCQVALLVFGQLAPEYCDGLLCDMTESAIGNWWTKIGSEHYNIEPADGILGPTTVAALLGLFMGARNRLNYLGAPVSKDAFDLPSLKRGIAYFQKSQKLDRTRRLDRPTLVRLHFVTAKAAVGDGWAVPKAVKSTVAELSGKGGEMVMEMVGGRDKAGIGDIETLYIDKFVGLVYGERAKWLWQGKPRRNASELGKLGNDPTSMIFSADDQGGFVWSSKRPESFLPDDETELRRRDTTEDLSPRQPGASLSADTEHLRERVLKSMTDKMTDARSGFGRFKDAVGFRGHASRQSRDIYADQMLSSPHDSRKGSIVSTAMTASTAATATPTHGSVTSLTAPQAASRAFTWKNKPEEYQDGFRKERDSANGLDHLHHAEPPPSSSRTSLPSALGTAVERIPTADEKADAQPDTKGHELRDSRGTDEPPVAESTDVGDANGIASVSFEANVLRSRRQSLSDLNTPSPTTRHDAWWPRRMSFSCAEEAILTWTDLAVWDDDEGDLGNWAALQRQLFRRQDIQKLYRRAEALRDDVGRWVQDKVDATEALDTQAAQDQERFQTLYAELRHMCSTLQESTTDIIEDRRAALSDRIKDLELLEAKLDYELNALLSKVEDVEDGVIEYAQQVKEIERRADEVEEQLRIESWLHWIVRTLTGIGTRPPPP